MLIFLTTDILFYCLLSRILNETYGGLILLNIAFVWTLLKVHF